MYMTQSEIRAYAAVIRREKGRRQKMNKMHTIQDVKQRIHELIQKEIAKCNKEIEEFERKISDNEIA